ncbi:hypothetical protein KIN20_012929 [Parelaphostrongylus tenuis]|uniref:Uncharacterized protein n=1 Tax=Parelaphostrongylus tenuis TaxID=148309 RepID=A0AAD5MET6_PARTN|nr:hypothetical protein KIN20_012929 [Parelaphostrongylus tenuis]
MGSMPISTSAVMLLTTGSLFEVSHRQQNSSGTGNALMKKRRSYEKQKTRNCEQNPMDRREDVRVKRQLLKDDVVSNTTWRDGVFYTFKIQAHDKVAVAKINKCSSNVGRLGGDQILCLMTP